MAIALTTSTNADRTQTARQFLDSLLGPLPQGTLEIRRKRVGEHGTRQEFHTSLDTIDLSKLEANESWWFGACLRKSGARSGKATDVAFAPVIWLDYDNVEDKDALVERLLEFKVPPTHIVDSGGGVHSYHKLDRAVDLGDEALTTLVREIVHGLAHALGADTKVHDLARVMRLPGTLNPGNGTTKVYNPPREVTLLHADETRRVPLEALSEFRRPINTQPTKLVTLSLSPPPIDVDGLRVSARWKNLIRNGWTKGCGYASRSELDHAVMVAMIRAGDTPEAIAAVFQDRANKIGEKFREKAADGPRYLATTLASAQQWVSNAEAQTRALRLEDGVMKAFRPGRNAWEQVYGKAIVPVARLRGSSDCWQVKVANDAPITLDSEALASAHSLKRALPPVGAWTGTDQDAQLLIPYFESYGVVERRSVNTIGWHGEHVVFPDGVLGPGGLETDSAFVYDGHYRGASLRVIENWNALAKTIGASLLGLHEPGVIYVSAGWFFATFVAPQIRALADNGFPLLNLYGTTGAGKTTILGLLWRMAGSTREPISIQGATDFTRTMNLSSTNTLPIVLDEHRTGSKREKFYSTLRESHNGADHERGRADLTVVRIPLTSPIAVAGESAFPDPALRQRSLIARLSPEMLGPVAPPSERRQRKAEFAALPLADFAAGFYQHIRTKNVPSLYREELDRVGRLIPMGADDRKRHGPATALLGLRLFEDFLPSFDPETAATAIAQVLDGEEEPSLLRLFVLTVFELIQQRKLRLQEDFKLEGSSLFLVPATAVPKVSKSLSQSEHTLPTSEDALRAALRDEYAQNEGQGIVREMRAGKWMSGKSTKVIELSLEAIEESLGIHRQQWEAVLDGISSRFP